MASALLTAAALLLPVRSLQQLAYVASVGLALLVMYAWGRLAARTVLSVERLGPATAIFLGQWTLLAFTEVATSLNALVAAATGSALPLLPIVVGPSIVGVYLLGKGPAVVLSVGRAAGVEARSGRTESSWPRPLSLLALGSLAVVTAIYSRHLSALGLDTHEHLAWTRQILTGGFVPLVEPTTSILADYPRTFHLLTATWNAAGLGLPPGPYVKIMPFLQAGLTGVALSELLARAAASRSGRSEVTWERVLGVACYLYAFLLVLTARPVPDLSGTPRYSSTGLLLIPIVLMLVATAHRSGAAARLSIALLPLVCAWALTMNPVTPVLLVIAGLPMLAVTWLALGAERPRLGGWSRAELAVPVLLAALVVVRDPWVVSEVAQRSRSVSGFLQRHGALTYDEAVRAGQASPHDKSFKNAPPQPACRAIGCATRIAGEVARDVMRASFAEVRTGGRELAALARDPSTRRTERALAGSLPIQPASAAPHAALPLAILLLAGVACAIGTMARRRTGPMGLAPRLLLWWTLGVLVTGFTVRFAGGMATALSDGTHEATILAGYLSSSGHPLSIGWLWVAFLLASMVLYDTFAPGAAERSGGLGATGIGALVAALALPSFAVMNLNAAWRNPAFMTNVGLGDLRALRRIEALIPERDRVIVPAEHWNIGDWEHWVIPVGGTAALLPYGNRRYLFNVYLGASFGRSWRDLEERLCGPSAAERRRFLDENHAPWLLLGDRGARAPEEAVARARICEKPVAGLFPHLEPVASDRGLYLFRIGAEVTPGASRAASP